MKLQNTEIAKLQDEIVSWKIHASRNDDTLRLVDNSQTPKTEIQELPQRESRSNKNEKPRAEKEYASKNTDDQRQSKGSTQNRRSNEKKEPEVTVDLTDEVKTKVVLLGTSNFRFISSEQLSSDTVKVEKFTRYTLCEGQKYIDTLKKKEDRMDAIVLHLLENDIADHTPEDCTEKIAKMTNYIKQRFTNTKVIVSLGLPQRNAEINRKISKVNFLLKEKLGEADNVSLCDNGNLFFRGLRQPL